GQAQPKFAIVFIAGIRSQLSALLDLVLEEIGCFKHSITANKTPRSPGLPRIPQRSGSELVPAVQQLVRGAAPGPSVRLPAIVDQRRSPCGRGNESPSADPPTNSGDKFSRDSHTADANAGRAAARIGCSGYRSCLSP